MEDVARANILICNIDAVTDNSLTTAERAQYKAEAKIFRAMIMFDMVRLWGDFPVITTVAEDITSDNIEDVYPQYFPEQNTELEAYQQIERDLLDAVQYAPDNTPGNKTLFTKSVARTLLAKIYAEKPLRDYTKVKGSKSPVFTVFFDGKRVIEVMQTSEADLCLFGHQSGRNSRPVCDQAEICKEGSIERARIRMLQAPTRYMQVWAKLFRRHQILASGVLFEPELHLAEDSDFTFQYTAFCRSAAFYPDIIYDYHINPVSVMHTFDKKKVEGYIRAMEVMTDRISEEKDVIQQACRQYILVHFHIAMVNGIFAGNDTDSFFNKVSEIRQTAKRPVFAKAIRQVSLRSGAAGRCVLPH